jgi:hypothetical protein
MDQDIFPHVVIPCLTRDLADLGDIPSIQEMPDHVRHDDSWLQIDKKHPKINPCNNARQARDDIIRQYDKYK